MEDNSLLMIVLAFVLGYMASGMMKQMCGGLLVEGSQTNAFGLYTLNDGTTSRTPPPEEESHDCEFDCTLDDFNVSEEVRKSECNILRTAKMDIRNMIRPKCGTINRASFCFNCDN